MTKNAIELPESTVTTDGQMPISLWATSGTSYGLFLTATYEPSVLSAMGLSGYLWQILLAL